MQRNKSHHVSAERQKLQKELFSFRKTVQHGFPNKPTALAWDPELRIAAIGTASGAIKIFGKSGVEFYGHYSTSDRSVTDIAFIPNEGKLVSLSDCNSLSLWEINDNAVEEVKSLVMEGKLKTISSIYVETSKENVLVGTEEGNIYFISLSSFTVTEKVIYQDVVIQSVPEERLKKHPGALKKNPGAVEIIFEQPNNPNNLLIGYSRGLMVLWDKENSVALKTYLMLNNQQLESLCWSPEGNKFVSSHNDGSYIYWSVDLDEPEEEPITVYGPFPCKAITKILWRKSADDDETKYVIFSGGMPRASYSDRHTVTVQKGTDKHVVFDFTSKVIDFFTTDSRLDGACEALIVLLEEEIVAIDLKSDDWRTISLPYLVSLHSSAVTYLTYVCDVSAKIWNDIVSAGKLQSQETSALEWPIDGGILKTNPDDEKKYRDVFITGHEDGSVRFWDAGSTVLSLIYVFKSNLYFSADDDFFDDDIANNQAEEEEEWPPFKKVGCFDPYVDDPRFAIKKVSFCGLSGALTVAGTAGQIIVCDLVRNATFDAAIEKNVKISTINLIPETESFADIRQNWKGFQKLLLKGKVSKDETTLSLPSGFQPSCILQLLPPTPITALALHSAWHLIAVGTAYGLALYDYKTNSKILYKCTLNASDFSTLNEPPISRTKSFKKSLRESFRRIRKGRASVRHNETKQRSGSKSPCSPVSPAADSKKSGNEPSSSSPSVMSPIEAKPIERAIEARPADDAIGNMVRCLCFAHTNIVNGQTLTPSLWAGTNNGSVYIFTMLIPGGSKRKNEKVCAQLGKEIQLKHRAPVVSLSIIDGANKALPEPFEVEEGLCKPADHSSPHHVVIGSEEQFKVFSLPNLKPTCKLKLTAMEGSKVRRMNLAAFKSSNHVETCLLSLTNLGECIVLSLPDLRRLVTAAVIKREDINGISSLAFTKWGEGLYLHSSSEIQRITLSASRKTIPRCTLKSHSKKKAQSSPIKEKLNSTLNSSGNLISDGIPEEDEEQELEENNRDKKNSSSLFDIKKSVTDEENQSAYNHDISAITVDSVKDHLNSVNNDDTRNCHTPCSQLLADKNIKKELNNSNVSNTSETNVSASSSDTTLENSIANVSITENRVEVSV